MKQINVYFEDNEFKKLKALKKAKKFKNWHDFILQLLPKEEVDDNK